MTTLDMSLDNAALYGGCVVTKKGGRNHLETESLVALSTVQQNAHLIFAQLKVSGETSIAITGAMTIWSYAAVSLIANLYFDEIFLIDKKGVQHQLKPSHDSNTTKNA